MTIMTSCASSKKKDGMITMSKKARLYYDQGTQELADKEYTVALNHLQLAIQNEPNNTHILNNLGMAYYFKGATGTAIKYLTKSLKVDNKNTPARMNLATIYMKNKQYEKAEKEYMTITKDLTYMAQFRTYYNLGILNLEKGRVKQGIAFLNKSIIENENYCPAHFQLGNHYYKKNAFNKAYKKYQDASFGVCFNNPLPHYSQAKALIKLGKTEKARDTLNKIIERFGTTKYSKFAQKRLKQMDVLENRDYLDQNSRKNRNRNILTPDF